MPTIALIGKIRIMIYLADHGRPHVHAVGPGAEAKIEIGSLVVVRQSGFSTKEMKLILEFIANNRERLLEAWKDGQE
jgi:hypothetical protein